MSLIPTVRNSVCAAIAFCALVLPVHTATAEAGVPDTLTLVVGYAPGGAADTTARAYAEQLRKDAAASTVIVENRPGASGRIGLNYVKAAKPDGATLYLVPSPLLTIFPLTYKAPGYDADKDFRAVATLVDIPTALVTGAAQPFQGMKDYMEWAKKNTSGTSLGVATLGSSGHLGILAVNQNHDVKIEPVAYRGASPMLVDVASGVVSIGWDAVASMMPLYEAKKIKFLGVSGTQRLDALPDVPTLAEQGFPEFKAATSFYGILAPAGTPDATVAALEQAFLKASTAPELRKQLAARGLVMAPAKGAAMAQRARDELESWRPVVERTGIAMD